MKTIQTKKSALFFKVIPLNNADGFLLQDNDIFLRLESLNEWFGFHGLNCVMKHTQDI